MVRFESRRGSNDCLIGIEEMKTKYVLIDSEVHQVSLSGKDQFQIGESHSTYQLERIDEYRYSLILDGKSIDILIEQKGDNCFVVEYDGTRCEATVEDFDPREKNIQSPIADRTNIIQIVRAPMPGLVSRIQVEIGNTILMGDALCVLEAMKMENEIRSTTGGVVKAIHVREKVQVERNQPLISIEKG